MFRSNARQLALRLSSLLAALGKAGREHDQAAYSPLRAGPRRGKNGASGNREHSTIDSLRQFLNGAQRRAAANHWPLRVDQV